ncbi:ABC transporter G family member 21-like [Oopsacas minuta]|uniref:ABC transporter G family member 21-like n=1 Tax=Oopsacas minuta TaxID=111878 RepID=A0AAV7JC98_9METZ|nr:ABC transporter G family member 21-like [Oopsacas minuta]
MLAIMGPSGSGKTTLLNTLAGNASNVYGWINIEGQKATKPLQKRIGYVLQEDSFLANLTLRETLLFTAVLKMEGNISLRDKKSRVDEIIRALGLEACCNTIMGGPGQRGLSGGEKKRANIACEMLAEPSILLLDEPTSGLDSTYAFSMIKRLRSLCNMKGISIVASIHQPSSELFNSFDSLLALSLGHTVYSGPIDGVVGYLAKLGLPCPSYYNPADHLMDKSVEKDSSNKLRKLWDEKQDLVGSKINGFCDGLDSNQPVEHLSATYKFNLCQHTHYPTSWFIQFAAILWRTFKNSKTLILSSQMIFSMTAIGLVIGVTYFQLPHAEANINDRYGLMFFIIIHATFISAFNNLITFAAERNVLNKDRASGLYHISAYYAAKSIAELPIQFFLPSLFFNICYWLSGVAWLPDDLGLYFVYWLALLLLVTTGSSVGSFFGAYFVDPGISIIYLPVLVVAWLMFGGFFSRNFPIWLYWLTYLSPANYGFDAALQIVFTENMIIQCRPNNSFFVGCNKGLITNVTGLDVLANGDVTIDFPLWVNILVLVLTIVFFRTIAYLSIRFLNRPHNFITRTKQKITNFYWKQYNALKENLSYCCSRRHIYQTQV